jgi:chaperonin GroES
MEIEQALAAARNTNQSILVTLKSDGRPQLSNVLHTVGEDGVLRISTTADRAKYANLRRTPWAAVVAIVANVRTVEVGDRVLFDPEDKSEVEVHGEVYVVMRERDVHAVAADRLDDGESTGLYL